MAANGVSASSSDAPSVKNCIAALQWHKDRNLFDMIAEFPQACIHERFGAESALAIAYVESKVHRCRRDVESFLRKEAQSEGGGKEEVKDEKVLSRQYEEVMKDLIDNVLLHGCLIKNYQKLNLAPSPSKIFMRQYRNHGIGSMRAANGELVSTYNYKTGSVPSNLATADNEDLEPMAQFVLVWLVNPINDYVVAPIHQLFVRLSTRRPRSTIVDDQDYGIEVASERILSAVANTLVYIFAILILVAPVATFNTIQDRSLRIVIMPLFCMLLAAAAQLMGPKSMPSFTLVIAYFQAMVVFVAISSE